MMTRLVLWLIAAAVRSTCTRLVERFRPLDRIGPETLDEVDEFVAEMQIAVAGEAGPPLDELEAAPIYEVLAEQWPALYAGRRRALRAPTQEIRETFDLLTVDWLCSHCEVDHVDCPGCSCACAGIGALVTA